MRRSDCFFFLLLFFLIQPESYSQPHQYSPMQSAALRDSIRNSRWDAGGAVSKYSFRYMSEFFPVAMINRSTQPLPLPSAPLKGLDTMLIKAGDRRMGFEDYLKSMHTVSFIVVHKGTVVYERYFSMQPGDKHTLQSVTKVITATLISSLVNEHKIVLGQPIEAYIPELKGTDWQGITVQQILDMRSGMDIQSLDISSGPFTNPKHKNYQLESALGILPKAATTPASVYEFIRTMKRDVAPGGDPAYSNINTFVLGWLAETVTGRKYADLVAERIWQPMGAEADAYECLSDKGIAWPHGGISATLRDLARFGMLYTHSQIRAKREQLISFSQLNYMFTAKGLPTPFGTFKWAYQWDLADDGLMMKSGFGGQALYVHPEKEIVIACFNYVDPGWDMGFISDDAIQKLIKVVSSRK